MLHPLELSLWRTETRFDRALMVATFAPDLVEFGPSGRRYSRDDLLPDGTEADLIDATLHALTVTALAPDLALVTYTSELRTPTGTEWANRSSIWDRSSGHWQLRFHQGTPLHPDHMP